MIDTILIDFDGVIRHWSNQEIGQAEHELGLNSGTLFSVAFSPSQLLPAITGQISHETWLQLVQEALDAKHSPSIAHKLITAWEEATFTIDYQFLAQIRSAANAAQLVLVTNATSKLPSDLQGAELANAFDVIVNSSAIGVAKPDIGFYTKAIELAGTAPNNCLFIDDSAKNVAAAQALGISSLRHTNSAETLHFIKQHL